MKRKHRVWYSLLRLDAKVWYSQGKWYSSTEVEDLQKNFSSSVQFKTLKQVDKHLNKKDNLKAEFYLTKWFIKHGESWGRDIKVYYEE